MWGKVWMWVWITHFDALEHDDWRVLGLLSIIGVGT